MIRIMVSAVVAAAFLITTGCSGIAQEKNGAEMAAYTVPMEFEAIEIADEAVALADSPAPKLQLYETVASGTAVRRNKQAVIDYSNAADGYVMVRYEEISAARLKVQVKGPKSTYTYNLPAQEWTVFPLSEGSGSYTVTVYQNVSGSRYAGVLAAAFEAELKDEFSAFLYPNQYVDYTPAVNTVDKAAELTKGLTEPLDKVAAVYDYVVSSLSYDAEKAASVQSGYLPVLDTVLAEKKGICFDYAALMTGMLRSQGIPCKLVVGYAGTAYHAWISVWSEKEGWIDGAIYFDGSSWQRMDPTFASSAGRSSSIMQYIGDGSNYTEKYLY
ncbi:MAG: transglutaminase domain-containing protein [Oscillospiraceae bacterium]|nr:transglutaminase domain-containing protein [Oscillospiraceae bacterium]